MSNKKIISIGIPAYNEEANIKFLLTALLKQKQTNFSLAEIIVVSDSSTDLTNEYVKNFKNKKIHLIVNPTRLGQSPSQEKIVQIFSGEILVLLNADVIPDGPLFIANLIEPFNTNKNLGLVSAKVVPLKATTLFESIINFSVECREAMLEKWNKGNNALHCHGAARAFTRDFAKGINWPTSIGEDAYTYFLCLSQNFEFRYQAKAVIFYRSPTNFTDHFRQSFRFQNSQILMSDLFGKQLVSKSYNIPLSLKTKGIVKYFFKNPLFWICYVIIFLATYFIPGKDKNLNPRWEVSQSSKKLLVNP